MEDSCSQIIQDLADEQIRNQDLKNKIATKQAAIGTRCSEIQNLMFELINWLNAFPAWDSIRAEYFSKNGFDLSVTPECNSSAYLVWKKNLDDCIKMAKENPHLWIATEADMRRFLHVGKHFEQTLSAQTTIGPNFRGIIAFCRNANGFTLNGPGLSIDFDNTHIIVYNQNTKIINFEYQVDLESDGNLFSFIVDPPSAGTGVDNIYGYINNTQVFEYHGLKLPPIGDATFINCSITVKNGIRGLFSRLWIRNANDMANQGREPFEPKKILSLVKYFGV